MKKLLCVSLSLVFATAYAATLTLEVTQDMKKICIYSDGSTITVSQMQFCPLSK